MRMAEGLRKQIRGRELGTSVPYIACSRRPYCKKWSLYLTNTDHCGSRTEANSKSAMSPKQWDRMMGQEMRVISGSVRLRVWARIEPAIEPWWNRIGIIP